MKILTPTRVVQITLDFLNILWVFGICSLGDKWSLRRSISKSLLCACVFVMYLNIASYLYGKQIKSKMGNKLYLQMIFICVCLNWLDFHECHTMPLKRKKSLQFQNTPSNPQFKPQFFDSPDFGIVQKKTSSWKTSISRIFGKVCFGSEQYPRRIKGSGTRKSPTATSQPIVSPFSLIIDTKSSSVMPVGIS